jgi:3-phenylpropionate/cinnamic acid dioxygenase small subunit
VTSLRERVEEFLCFEAKLLDEHRYEEWLALWTEDALYWVPCNTDDADPALQTMIIYDNHARLSERIYRLTSEAAWAQQPRSRTLRLISNLVVRQNENDYSVESNCLIAELRRSRQDLFAARMLHTLRPAGDSFRIVLKKVLLLNNDEAIDNLTFLV